MSHSLASDEPFTLHLKYCASHGINYGLVLCDPARIGTLTSPPNLSASMPKFTLLAQPMMLPAFLIDHMRSKHGLSCQSVLQYKVGYIQHQS